MSSPDPQSGASPYRVVVALGVGVLALTGVAGVLWRMGQDSGAGQRVGSDDPNSLRLLYVRPDCGEQVYDANGRSLGSRPVGNIGEYWWKPDVMKREFVFACRNDNSLFDKSVSLYLNGKPAPRVWGNLEIGDTNDLWIMLHCQAKVPRAVPSKDSGPRRTRLPHGGEPVRTVDAHISYHTGPRGPAKATFVGPFREKQQVLAQEGPNFVMLVKRSSASDIYFVFSGPPPIRHDAPVLAYTEGGRRHLLDRGDSSTTTRKPFHWEIPCRRLALESITHITLDERPATQVYRGVQVAYPDLPVRTYPALLDEIVERLNLEIDLSDPYAVDAFVESSGPFDSPSQALSILDIACGDLLYRATNTLYQIKPSDLTEAERKRLADILAAWVDGDRQVQACHLGLWAEWPAYADRTLSVLHAGDMGDNTLTLLARDLCKYPNPTAEQLASITDLLLNKNIEDQRARNGLVEYVYRHSGDETEHLRRLAECNKPWIWSRVIRPDWRFREFLDRTSASRTVRLRAVAMDMDSWIDQAETLKPEAYDLLADAITPEFYRKSFVDFDRVFTAFARHTPPDKGTEVLLRYLERQVTEWKARRQIDGAAFFSDGGVWRVVRQLNRWNDVNVGGLGPDFDISRPVVRTDWREVAASALHWARTGEDLSRLLPTWRLSDRDLRVVWYNRSNPEGSRISLWPYGEDPNVPKPYVVMEADEDFLYYTIRQAGFAARGMSAWNLLIQAGTERGPHIDHEFTFTFAGLPKLFDPHRMNVSSRRTSGTWQSGAFWHGKWEIRIEYAAAGAGVLDGTRLFVDWKARYLAGEPAVPPPEHVFGRDDPGEVPEESGPLLLR